MLYLLTWRKPHPGYPNSGAGFRPIIAHAEKDTFTPLEHTTFQVIERPDLEAKDMACFLGMNGDDLMGPLMKMAPEDSPVRRYEFLGWDWDDKPINQPIKWTAAEMAAKP